MSLEEDVGCTRLTRFNRPSIVFHLIHTSFVVQIAGSRRGFRVYNIDVG
jgi:hypothetical protein